MSVIRIIWDLVEDPDGNVQHIATHGITIEEVEEVLLDRNSEDTTSRSSGRPDHIRVHVTWTLSRRGLGTCR